jgi:alginate O-acetyltransferase complex protein AlgI
MNFISLLYALFLIILLVIYWNQRSPYFKLSTLVIFSVIFYLTNTSKHWYFFPVIIIMTIINYLLGKNIGINSDKAKKAQNPNLSNEEWQSAQTFWNQWRSKILIFGIIFNVLVLLSFKYLPFILPSNPEKNVSINNQFLLTMPLGLSFFVFECIAYLVDIYRGAPGAKNFIDFAAYKLFFPKLISGPITRYHHFATESEGLKLPKIDQWTEGLWLIAFGAVKKGIFADNLGKIADLIFGNGSIQRAGSIDLWVAIFGYGLQLYLDFSGYVDIARGTAMLLGFNLPENFNFPYFSTSIADFWRKWHITLGDWLRNYIYFPLGGSRKGLIRTCLNLFIIMIIAGIWHGSLWGYVVWGAWHGIALIVHRITEALAEQSRSFKEWWESNIGIIFAWLITQFTVFISWIFFRLPNLNDSTWVIAHLWGHNGDVQFAQKIYGEAIFLNPGQLTLLMIILTLGMSISYAMHRGLKLQLNWPVKLLLVPICFYAVWLFAPKDALPYIYFDF